MSLLPETEVPSLKVSHIHAVRLLGCVVLYLAECCWSGLSTSNPKISLSSERGADLSLLESAVLVQHPGALPPNEHRFRPFLSPVKDNACWALPCDTRAIKSPLYHILSATWHSLTTILLLSQLYSHGLELMSILFLLSRWLSFPRSRPSLHFALLIYYTVHVELIWLNSIS